MERASVKKRRITTPASTSASTPALAGVGGTIGGGGLTPAAAALVALEATKKPLIVPPAPPPLGSAVPLDVWKAILCHPETPLLQISRFAQTSRRFKDAVCSLGHAFLVAAEHERRLGENMKLALQLLYKACVCKNTQAMLHLGWVSYWSYGWGFETPRQTLHLRNWFQKAYEWNNSLHGGLMYIHMHYQNEPGSRYKQTITRAVKHSINSDPFVRAMAYFFPIGYTRTNKTKALEWFQKADETDEHALLWLGEYWRSNDLQTRIFGVSGSPERMTDKVKKQFHYYTKAAQLGNAAAQLRLAFLYRDVDSTKCEYWKQKAYDQGCGNLIELSF